MPDLESIRKRAATNDIDEATDTDDLIRACNVAMMDRNVLLAEVERLTTALATAKDEERAAVVAYARQRADEWASVGVRDDARVFRDVASDVESNRHREKA